MTAEYEYAIQWDEAGKDVTMPTSDKRREEADISLRYALQVHYRLGLDNRTNHRIVRRPKGSSSRAAWETVQ